MGLCKAQCKMLLFYVKTDREELHNFELADLKKEEEENQFAHLSTFWFGTFASLFRTIKSLENTGYS